MHPSQTGVSLLELIVVLALTVIAAMVAAPALIQAYDGLLLDLAAGEISGVMHRARLAAVRYRAHVAVKFRLETDGRVSHGLYRDGDGDGVRNLDIDAGVDPELRPARILAHLGQRVRFGFPPGDPPDEICCPGRPLERLEDPIRFNRSDLASFTPLGKATPGTIYLTDGRRRVAAVRVSNRSGRITVWTWDHADGRWRRR